MLAADKIRNSALVGATGSGKTSLAEALAFKSGATNRLGSVNDGNTLCDYHAEEKEKKHSLVSGVIHLAGKTNPLTLVDTPGYPDYVGEAIAALSATETGVLVVAADNDTIPFHAHRVWEEAETADSARAVVVTKLDGDNLDWDSVLGTLREGFGDSIVPITLPDGVGSGFTAITSGMDESAEDYATLVERVVEGDDALMERYFEEGTLPLSDLQGALSAAMAARTFTPLFVVDPVRDIGVAELLDFMCTYFPSADLSSGDATSPLAARVWKVASDKHVGQISYLRVYEGTIKGDGTIPTSGKPEKVAGLGHPLGAELVPCDTAGPGEIVAVTRIDTLNIGDELREGDGMEFIPLVFPEPFTALAVRPKSRDDEQKIGPELAKAAKEDATFCIERNADTHEMLALGLSEVHLRTILHRIELRGVGIDTSLPRIAYRETVTGRADGHHRHKKQTGGSGQFGECYVRIAPRERGEGFEFVDAIVGGSIPRQFIPAVQKGMEEQMVEGMLAGYPVVDLQVELYDGKHHDVDSDEMSFKKAGSMAMKDAFSKAAPILLEPIMDVTIRVPSRFMGDISGDLNTRRGRILGMDAKGDLQIIQAQAPLAELQSYGTHLRSLTAGEGDFAMSFVQYEQVPSHLMDKIVQASAEE